MTNITKQEKIDAIKEILNNLDDSELFGIHCDYCDAINYPDDRMYSMEEFNDLYNGNDPLEIAGAICGTDFSANDNYFWYNGYGNLESGYAYDHVDTEEVAEWMLENENSLGNDDIQELFDEWEENEEDEDDGKEG